MPNPKLPVIPESPPREYWRLLEPSTEDNPGETIRLGDEFSYTTPVRWDHVPVLWIGKKAGDVAIIRRRVAPPCATCYTCEHHDVDGEYIDGETKRG